MTDFLAWSWQARTLLVLLLALCVLAQAMAMVLSFYSRKRRLRALPELLLLVLLLFCSLLYGQALESFAIGLLAPMPEGHALAWAFLAAMLFSLPRSVYICLRRYREIRTSISALSIKSAMDSLRTGVLFSAPDGFILLFNAQMQRLMTAFAGRVYRNGNDFYDLLASGVLRPGCRKTEFEGRIVCLLPDDTAWQFSQTALRIGKKRYIHLTAADITERWELTARLQRQNGQLRQRNEKLKETIDNLHMLCQEREAQKAKMRAHDILGQRMALLLRTVRESQALDYGLLQALSRGLMDELKAIGEPSPRDVLEGLRQEFGFIGVELRLEGPPPEDRAKGTLFADIVRESATNAVRHGYATRVLVQVEPTRAGFQIRVTDNGSPPPEGIAEGGGLSGMRKKAEAQGGTLRVKTRPRFTLEIFLPEENADA
ncbi:MAG: hypothetical protein FWH26_00375 [Oscillospiraceae bacterium]|nr:hypothetical protein [Oscillospiraceae bacterium]